jgi:hypothetical protein
MIKTYHRSELSDDLNLPYNLDIVQSDQITGTTRWSEIHELVFQDPDDRLFWRVSYSQGLTEDQDEVPFGEESPEDVDAVQMMLRPLTVLRWVEV